MVEGDVLTGPRTKAERIMYEAHCINAVGFQTGTKVLKVDPTPQISQIQGPRAPPRLTRCCFLDNGFASPGTFFQG